ncbi:MAG: hypothetical protein ABIM30_00430 [candidate division WOR-3 bacterium]
MAYSKVKIQVIGSRTVVLSDIVSIKSGNPVYIDCTLLEDNLDLRHDAIKAIKSGLIEVYLGDKKLTPDDVLHIDEIRESDRGAAGDSKIMVCSYIQVEGEESVNVNFSNPDNSDYGVVVTVLDNINTWIQKQTSTSFVIHFSAPYTGRVDYLVYKIDS